MKRWLVSAAAASVMLLGACDSESPVDTSCCRVLTRVDLTPDVATVTVGDSVQFTATAYDEDNVAVETDAAFAVLTSSRGVLTTTTPRTTYFRAQTAGNTYVRAIIGTLRDSTLVTVTSNNQ